MANLLIESSQKKLIVGLFTEEKILTYLEEPGSRVASEKTAVFVQSLFKEAKISAKDLDLILINSGPGSFTGLRVAASFALGLSAVYDIKLATYTSFDLLQFIKTKENIDFFLLESKFDEFYYKKKNSTIKTILKEDFYREYSDAVICTFAGEALSDKVKKQKNVNLEMKLIFDYYMSKKGDLKEQENIQLNYYHEFAK